MSQEVEEKKGKSRWTWVIIILCLLVASIAAGYTFWQKTSGDDSSGQQQAPEQIRKFTPESFLVNPAGGGYRRFMKITLTLEYTDKSLDKELVEKQHRIRHAVINILRSKAVEDLDSRDEAEKLRQELLTAINSILTEGSISGLYFEEFIIQ